MSSTYREGNKHEIGVSSLTDSSMNAGLGSGTRKQILKSRTTAAVVSIFSSTPFAINISNYRHARLIAVLSKVYLYKTQRLIWYNRINNT